MVVTDETVVYHAPALIHEADKREVGQPCHGTYLFLAADGHNDNDGNDTGGSLGVRAFKLGPNFYLESSLKFGRRGEFCR